MEQSVPFLKLNDNEFNSYINNSPPEEDSVNISLISTVNQTNLIDKMNNHIKNFNNFQFEPSEDFESPINCNYYSCGDFQKQRFNEKSVFSIIHLNIHSINLHIDDLRLLLIELNFKFDIIALTETKLKCPPIVDISLEGYHPPTHSFTKAEKGGTLLYIANSITFKPRKDLEISEPKLIESTFIEIINKKESNNIVGVLYRHPTMDPEDFNDTFLKLLLDKLAKCSNKKIFLAGDFNFNLLNLTSHEQTEIFYSNLLSNLFLPAIILPTKINNVNNTLIDNIFSNQINSNTISGNISVNISDGHLPSFCMIPKRKAHFLPKKHQIFKRDMKSFDQEDFLLDFATINWRTDDNIDANTLFDNFYEKMNHLVDKHIPLKKISNRNLKLSMKPWITKGIITSIRRKDKLFHTYCKTKNKRDVYDIHSEYKKLKNKINELIHLSKKNHFSKFFTKYSNDSKKVWEGIKSIISIKSNNNLSPNCIAVNNNLIEDPKKIANHFNDYFTSIADNILKKEKRPIFKTFKDYLPNPNEQTFVFQDCDPYEIMQIIKKLKLNKSYGPYSFPTEIMHLVSAQISIPLSKIFNISVHNGTHPEKLKCADIIPIHKKGSNLIVSNYRPISLLSNINKIFEKMMFKRISTFLEKYNLLHQLQFGFRKKHSTTHALVGISDKIQTALDEGNIACGIFVDFQKAFDTIHLSILLKKLEYYGFRGFINNWFSSYLTNRKQRVSINGYYSDYKLIKHGVPQGSVLGPLLFLLYINDLHNCIKHSLSFHFADDTNLLNINNNFKTIEKQVNRDLRSLINWLSANKISLNQGKTELVFFRKRSTKIPNTFKIKLNGKKLFHTKTIKYLGITLDEHLTGKYHVDYLITKLNRSIGLLAKARHYVPTKVLCNIYHAVFASHIHYGSQIWSNRKKILQTVTNIQKKAIRIMNFADYREHTEPFFKKLNLLKFQDYVTLTDSLFLYSSFCGDNPTIFNGIFKKTNDHIMKTRYSSILFKIPSFKTIRYGKNSIINQCIYSWNSIARKVMKFQSEAKGKKKELSTLTYKNLKSLIKQYFISTYTDINMSYNSNRFYVADMSLNSLKIKLKKSRGPYYAPFNCNLKSIQLNDNKIKICKQ